MGNSDKQDKLPDDLQLALAYGLYLFPLKAGAKSPPLLRNWEAKASNDPDQIFRWMRQFPRCNWGIAPGRSGHCVLDEDKAGALAELDLLYGPIPPTFTTITHSDKQHSWLTGVTKSATKPFPGIGMDIKSRGGYVVAPGSVVEGKRYRWGENRPFARLPEPLQEALKPSPHDREPRTETPACELDTALAVSLATNYLKNEAEPSIEGVTEGLVYRTACRVRDLGVSQDVCEDLMLRYWNPRCEPPWAGEEIESHFLVRIANAYRYAQNQAGCDNPAADFDEIPESPSGEEGPQDLKEALQRALKVDFLKEEFPEPRPLIRGLLWEGHLVLIFALPGVGKTLIGLWMACALSRGGALWGEYAATAPVKVLFVDGEMACRELQGRIKTMRDEPKSQNLRILSSEWMAQQGLPVPNLAKPEWRKAILDIFREDPAIKVLFLDNLVSLAPGLDENSTESWAPVNQFLLKLRRMGVAVLMVHHSGKNGDQRGTSHRLDNLDTALRLEALQRKDTTIRIEFVKARSIPAYLKAPIVLERKEADGRWWWSTTSDEEAGMSELLTCYAKGLGQKEIAAELRVSQSSVSRKIAKAKMNGWINTKSRQLTPEGERVMESSAITVD